MCHFVRSAAESRNLVRGKVPTGGRGLRRHASFGGLVRGREGACIDSRSFVFL